MPAVLQGNRAAAPARHCIEVYWVSHLHPYYHFQQNECFLTSQQELQVYLVVVAVNALHVTLKAVLIEQRALLVMQTVY